MKSGLSRLIVTATLLVCAALIGALAFTLFRDEDTASPSTDDGTAAPSVPTPATPSQPATLSSRPVPTRPATTRPPAPANPAADSPRFRLNQWIALVDTYPTDGALPAEQTAKDLATQLRGAGIAARALLAKGQYPGLAKGDGTPLRDAWIVYIGPSASPGGARNVCAAPKTQQIYSSPVCPTFEPARG